jgi:hypothetical protein
MPKKTAPATTKVSEGKFKCEHEGCERSFPSAQALRMHTMRRHERIGVQKGDNGETKTRRPRKQAARVSFCPCCGLNLQMLDVAMNVALKHS